MDDAAPEPSPPGEGERDLAPRIVTMIEHDGQEIPRDFPDRRAEAAWAAVSAVWHPAILARLDALPATTGAEFPSIPEPREIRILAEGVGARLPADHRSIAIGSGAILLEGSIDRAEMVRTVLRNLDPSGAVEPDFADPLALDFLALGTARLFLRDLTNAMGHADTLDVMNLTRETLAAARAWGAGDRSACSGHLRAAFELLTQAREKFYPVDSYLVDVCLIDPSFPAGALADPISARAPVTFLGTARAIERLAEVDPERVAALRDGINEGWIDVVGGTYDESDEAFAPLNSILWQFLKGGEVYRRHLDDRNVETLATRRFALYPQRPQVARRLGFRYALHVGLDAGRFPIPRETKRLWEAPDSSHLESLMRPPVAADRASEGLRLPWRIGRSMKDDHVATVPLMHWPSPVAGWYRDLRRVSAYSPVLSRWVTMGDYFHMSDRPWEMFAASIDDYEAPYLAQAVARDADRPISSRADHARARAAIDGVVALDALHRALTALPPAETVEVEPRGPLSASDSPFASLEESLETGRPREPEPATFQELHRVATRLGHAIASGSPGSEPGYLVLNPTGVSRTARVDLGEDPSRTADLAPFGFAWIPERPMPPEPGKAASVEGLILRGGDIEAEVDRATGGLRAVRARGEATPRLGQQLVIAGLLDPSGAPATSRMEADSVETRTSGPAFVAVVSRGRLLHPSDGRVLARFTQTVSLWSGRPVLDLDISLETFDPEWKTSLEAADPWTKHLACRWAWPDRESALRRTHLLGTYATKSPRPETPDAIEILSRKQKTTLLFGGLAHHRRHGERMLDTLLVAGRETSSSFRLGIVLDQDFAASAIVDFIARAPAVPIAGPPASGPAGWLLMCESRAIQIARVEFVEHYADGPGSGLAITLIETAGRAVRSRLRLFRDPKEARQTDFAGEVLFDLPTEGDAVPVDLTPYEMIRLEVRLA